MKQFRDILVYAEHDDPACLERVVALATAHGAAITVCEIVEPPPQLQDNRGVVERISKLRWSRAFERLRRICEVFASHTVIDYSVFTGVPFVTITEQVVQQDFDLVVHISEPVQAASGTGLNATGMHLMRKCPCAVWALHPQHEEQSRDILLALDRELAEGTRAAEAFAMSLAETALALASAQNARLHVLHAWEAYGSDVLEDDALELSDSEVLVYRRQQRSDSEQWFRRMVQRIESIADDPLSVKSHLVEGEAVASVEQLMEDLRPGMLVMGTVGTSANPGVLIGATTESILAQVGTPVLALKPPGFVSPLVLARQR